MDRVGVYLRRWSHQDSLTDCRGMAGQWCWFLREKIEKKQVWMSGRQEFGFGHLQFEMPNINVRLAVRQTSLDSMGEVRAKR